MKHIKESVAARRAGLVTALTVGIAFMLAGPASATPADPVGDAFGDAQDKVTQYGGAMILLILVGLGIMLGVKYLGKGFRKA